MNKPDLSVMDIYPSMLQDSYGLCEAILTEDYGYTDNDFFKRFISGMSEHGLDDLSTQLVEIMFEITEGMIKEKDSDAEVDYQINGCDDTYFYINGEQQ